MRVRAIPLKLRLCECLLVCACGHMGLQSVAHVSDSLSERKNYTYICVVNTEISIDLDVYIYIAMLYTDIEV